MSHAANHPTADDKTTLRRLALAVLAMGCGALGLVALALSIGS